MKFKQVTCLEDLIQWSLANPPDLRNDGYYTDLRQIIIDEGVETYTPSDTIDRVILSNLDWLIEYITVTQVSAWRIEILIAGYKWYYTRQEPLFELILDKAGMETIIVGEKL